MPASGYSLAAVATVPAGGAVQNIVKDLPGVKLSAPSKVEIFLTRSVVEVQIQVTVGGTNVYPQGPANISLIAGSLPSTQDDRVITVFGQASDEILIAAFNTNAADQEARALVKVLPIDDVILASAIRMRRGQV